MTLCDRGNNSLNIPEEHDKTNYLTLSKNVRELLVSQYISEDKKIRGGARCLKDTRLAVEDVVSIVCDNEQDDYKLTNDQIDACFIDYYKL
jgi:uncharacterized protein (DUF433 family)